MTKKTTVSIFGGGFVGGTTYKVLKQLEEKQWDSWQIHLYDVNPEIATVSKEQAITEADIAFVAVPTPTDFSRKTCDTSIVESVVREIRQGNKDCEIIIKSTVPPGTTEKLAKECGKVFFNPEFLIEKNALQDFVDIEYQFLGIGKQEQSDENVFEKTQELFKALSTEKVWNTRTIILGDCTNIELVKYGRNSYLALRLSYFQELRAISEALGCDPEFVKGAVGLDPRIGNHYNTFNGKWGGKCLTPETKIKLHDLTEKSLQDIKIGDVLFDPFAENNKSCVIAKNNRNVKELIKLNVAGRILKSSTDHLHIRWNKEKLEEISADKMTKNDNCVIPFLENKNKDSVDYVIMGEKPSNYIKIWHEKIKLNRNISRLIGLYLAEGCSGYTKRKNKNSKSSYVIWSFGLDEEYLANEIQETLKNEFNIYSTKSIQISKNATFGISKTYRVRSRNIWLKKFLEKTTYGNSCYNKNINIENINNIENRLSIFGGWLDGDGSLYKNTISGHSESKDLIHSFDSILLGCGISSNIQKEKKIIISERNSISRIINYTNRLKNKEIKYKTNYSYKSPTKSYIKEGVVNKITSIEKIIEETQVIAIETTSGRYIANNILTHNCLPKDINALAGIALEAGVEPVMLEATWERNMLTPGKEDWHEIPGAVVKKVE